MGSLVGIGFTVSLFVSNLAFEDAAGLTQAKLGVLAGTLLSALVGAVWLRVVLSRTSGHSSAR
ncbi:Na+/H+ antiporter NhaA [Deinococcus hohokamensis]|uniref:Na+/H+ antiporter NhaA n=1 Tax=Deinococcus hohokamensis TaxID=309883 RepID=A0ABV9I8U0_9DEIO